MKYVIANIAIGIALIVALNHADSISQHSRFVLASVLMIASFFVFAVGINSTSKDETTQ